MNISVKEGQTLIDVAVEYLGDSSEAMNIALLNGISITDELESGTILILPNSELKYNNPLPVTETVTEKSLLQLLTAHTSRIGGATAAHVRSGGNVRIDADGMMWVEITQSSAKIKRHNFVGDISYCGTAPVNSTEASTNWSLTKIEISASGVTTVTRAIGSWNNHLTANYN